MLPYRFPPDGVEGLLEEPLEVALSVIGYCDLDLIHAHAHKDEAGKSSRTRAGQGAIPRHALRVSVVRLREEVLRLRKGHVHASSRTVNGTHTHLPVLPALILPFFLPLALALAPALCVLVGSAGARAL